MSKLKQIWTELEDLAGMEIKALLVDPHIDGEFALVAYSLNDWERLMKRRMYAEVVGPEVAQAMIDRP